MEDIEIMDHNPFVTRNNDLFITYFMGEGSFATLIRSAFESGHYTGFLLTSWIIAVPLGFMLQKLIMSDYYRRTLF